MGQGFYVENGQLYGPPPPAHCETCEQGTQKQVVTTPYGWAWQCKRCLAVSDENRYEFDPTASPDGRTQGLKAVRTLQQLIIGLRNSQEGPLDPDDLYEVIGPYFRAGWCIRDVHHGLNYLPNGALHPDSGWNDKLPRKQLLYRVKRRLQQWRWAERNEDDDIMDGGWTAMRNAMGVAAQRQRERQLDSEYAWHAKAREAKATGRGSGLEAARAAAAQAASLSLHLRAEGERRELGEIRRKVDEASGISPLYLDTIRATAEHPQ
ncbi:hypothetical protein ACGGAQ_30220 [Micromonospora sp. NPDC047557]|uniref:hypothetical protein n=1 Tax=Micromonospora sp. NPDC047557 TaxID=3364250 RepID=UPI00371A3EF5